MTKHKMIPDHYNQMYRKRKTIRMSGINYSKTYKFHSDSFVSKKTVSYRGINKLYFKINEYEFQIIKTEILGYT